MVCGCILMQTVNKFPMLFWCKLLITLSSCSNVSILFWWSLSSIMCFSFCFCEIFMYIKLFLKLLHKILYVGKIKQIFLLSVEQDLLPFVPFLFCYVWWKIINYLWQCRYELHCWFAVCSNFRWSIQTFTIRPITSLSVTWPRIILFSFFAFLDQTNEIALL